MLAPPDQRAGDPEVPVSQPCHEDEDKEPLPSVEYQSDPPVSLLVKEFEEVLNVNTESMGDRVIYYVVNVYEYPRDKGCR